MIRRLVFLGLCVACGTFDPIPIRSLFALRSSTPVYLTVASGVVELDSYDITTDKASRVAQLPETATGADPPRIRTCGDAIVTIVDNTVYYVPPHAAVPVPLYSEPAGILIDAVADDDSIYVLAWYHVRRVPLSGGPFTELATGVVGPTRVTMDAANVYWTVTNDGLTQGPSTNGAVMSVAKGGGTVTTIASQLAEPRDIVDVNDHLYWIESASLDENGSVIDFDVTANTRSVLATNLQQVQSLSVVVGSAFVLTNFHDIIAMPFDGTPSQIAYSADGETVNRVLDFAIDTNRLVIFGSDAEGHHRFITSALQ